MENQKCSCGSNNKATRKLTFNDGEYYCCESNDCKVRLGKDLEELHYRNKYFQGKSQASYDSSAKIMFWTVVLLCLFAIGHFFVCLISSLS